MLAGGTDTHESVPHSGNVLAVGARSKGGGDSVVTSDDGRQPDINA